MQDFFATLSVLASIAGSVAPQLPVHGRVNEQRIFHTEGRKSALSKDLLNLIKDLRARSATVKLSNERVSQPFFSTPGRVLYVDGENVWVFSYRTLTAANHDVSKVSRDGMTIGNSKPSWLGTPHFFRRPKLIVLYLGDNPAVLDVLKQTVGIQFAGG
jgi:hypothetical protein